ncbi:MAG: hypothetical protein MZW92_69110 [Comamonadaceae bacterium]|nr:hypothetical protein [Comamonadaceae bacterium]
MPFINWTLFVAVVLLVRRLPAAPSSAGRRLRHRGDGRRWLIDSVLIFFVMRRIWKLVAAGRAGGRAAARALIDLAFFAANAAQDPRRRLVPARSSAPSCFTLLTTWKRGRAILMRAPAPRTAMPLEPLHRRASARRRRRASRAPRCS